MMKHLKVNTTKYLFYGLMNKYLEDTNIEMKVKLSSDGLTLLTRTKLNKVIEAVFETKELDNFDHVMLVFWYYVFTEKYNRNTIFSFLKEQEISDVRVKQYDETLKQLNLSLSRLNLEECTPSLQHLYHAFDVLGLLSK